MDYLIICIVALLVAGLTFFSGFGLGTLLMPAFAIFFPVEVAIAATAIVHLLNNVFKVILVGRNADKKILLLFALPAAFCAMLGAWLLNMFSQFQPIIQYSIGDRLCLVTPVKLVIAVLMVLFAIVELLPLLNRLSIKEKYLPIGGMLSGFFGGLSGHQGALRTAFLMRTNMSKSALIGTMVVSSVIVDISRLMIYGLTFFERDIFLLKQQGGFHLVLAGSLCAFFGSFIGSRILENISLQSLKVLIAIMLLLVAIALGIGVI